MNETEDELRWLQGLLDRSIAGSGEHLTSIVEPGRRTLSAQRLCAELRGMRVLSVATVTASGQPRLSAVDGHFLHARWYFCTAANAVKARHLRARPAVSVGYTPRDGFGVWAHGSAVQLAEESTEWRRLLGYLSAYYGQSPTEWAERIAAFRVQPHWMVGYTMTDAERAEFGGIEREREARLEASLRELG